MDRGKLCEMNLSSNEIGRLEKAFSNTKFRDLFAHYLKEMQDPENQKAFENEIIEMEKQRGNDVLLIKPTPHCVLKTSVDGHTKAYVNFSRCNSVNKISSVPTRKDSTTDGFTVSIPYSLSPARKTRDKHDRPCNVYCVVFHPTTLDRADENEALKKAVQETAFSAIEKSMNVCLDKVNFRTSKKQSKGPLEMTMVRKNNAADLNVDMFAAMGEYKRVLTSSNTNSDEYVTPSYKIKYRNEIDLQNSTSDKYCKMNVLIPQQMIIEIYLPLLKSIQDAKLDVDSASIELTNEDPKYKFQLTLPYEVNEDSGSAKFDADSRILTLQLDLKKRDTNTITRRESPLIDETAATSIISSTHSNISTIVVDKDEITFLAPNVKYKLPRYLCNYHKNTLAFTLDVKNVVRSSLERLIFEKADGFWVKFYSLGSGQFPMHYSMRITFTEPFLTASEAVDYRIEDDRVFLYARLNEDSQPLEYTVGVDANSAETAYLNEVDAFKAKCENEKPLTMDFKVEVPEINADQVVINMRPSKMVVKEELQFDSQKLVKMKFDMFCDQFRSQFTLEEESHSLSESELLVQDVIVRNDGGGRQTSSDAENGSWVTMKTSSRKLRRKKKARDKNSLAEESIVEDGAAEISESANESVDESRDSNATSRPIDIRSAYRYSDLSSRSILKKNRSFSESSGDESFYIDYARSYSTDGINFSSDSYGHSGPKKTVTFNDVISKKLFCSDVSILEQLKRQRRHSRRKSRRASDSENSETENGEATVSQRRENIRVHNETLLSETGSETDLTSSLSESGGETSDDQGESLDVGVQRPPRKQQPIPSSKKGHKRRGKKSARKSASSAKHQHHGDVFV